MDNSDDNECVGNENEFKAVNNNEEDITLFLDADDYCENNEFYLHCFNSNDSDADPYTIVIDKSKRLEFANFLEKMISDIRKLKD